MLFVFESPHNLWSDSNTALPFLRFLKYETSNLFSVSLSRGIRFDESPFEGHRDCNWLREEGLMLGSALPVAVKLNSLYCTNWQAVRPMVCAPTNQILSYNYNSNSKFITNSLLLYVCSKLDVKYLILKIGILFNFGLRWNNYIPTKVTRSWSVKPLSENFCLWTATESVGAGKLLTSDAEETLPSLLPSSTDQLGPPVYAKYTYILIKSILWFQHIYSCFVKI